MRVRKLELVDFRTYEHELVEFGPGVSILQGRNGAGKTNVLEAIGYLSAFRSHRVATDQPLVRICAPAAVLRGDLIRAERSTKVETQINIGSANTVRVAGVPTRIRDAVGILRTVVFAPEDLAIINGDPSRRRDFTDQLLVQRSPRYSAAISEFDRALRQRTTLLRSLSGRSVHRVSEDTRKTLRTWDEQLATSGAALLCGRLRLLDELAPLIEKSYAALAPDSTTAVAYSPKSLGTGVDEKDLPRDESDLAALLIERMAQRQAEELERGQSLVGPHRDDLRVEVDGKPARGYASHGESWSLALAFRLGSFELLRESNAADLCPVLLLDDVFAELDSARRDYLAEIALRSEQTIITAAVMADVPDRLHHRVLTVVPGSVSG